MEERGIRVLCVYKSGRLPSSRIRILQMIPYLEREGVMCDAVEYPRSRGELKRLAEGVAQHDVVWLQKKLPGLPEYLVWRRLGRPVVFDYDDAICFRKEPKWGSYRWPRRARRFRRITRLAVGVTCGNRYLAELLPPGAGPVVIYPSPVPVDVPCHDYHSAAGPLVLGWIGDGGNLGCLAALSEPLQALARRHDFVLRVVTDRDFSCSGVRVENVRWTVEGQHRALATFDVGLMPLNYGSPFDRGKCAYKVLQYMAAGVVPVADAVGMNAEVIEDRANGRLVFRDGEWFSVLDELLSVGRAGLSAMGARGPLRVREEFSYPPNAARLARAFQVFAGKSPGESKRRTRVHPQARGT